MEPSRLRAAQPAESPDADPDTDDILAEFAAAETPVRRIEVVDILPIFASSREAHRLERAVEDGFADR